MTADEEFARLLAEVELDPAVVGLVLGGSRGKGALVRPDSDYDVYVLAASEADVTTCRRRYGRPRGEPIDVVVLSLDGFRDTDPSVPTLSGIATRSSTSGRSWTRRTATSRG